MTDPQPEYVWAHSDDKPKRGRVWLIVVLIIAAVTIAAGVFWLFLRPGAPLGTPASTSTPTSAPSTSPTATAPMPTASSTPETTPTPVDTPPPVPDPSLAAFRGQVGGWVRDALTGLDIVSESSGQDALSVIDSLKGDAQRMAGVPAPSSISAEWTSEVAEYGEHLTDLREAVSSGSSPSVDDARSAAEELRRLIGL